jgi:D-alanine transaminase
MPHIAYVNGRYLPHSAAAVHIEDRGYQFADGAYEVIAVHRGRLIDEAPHLDRLDYSLSELRIAWPMTRRALGLVMREVVRRNAVEQGIVYLQMTRGVAPRDHAFPARCRTAVVITAKRVKRDHSLPATGAKVSLLPDLRWGRCDIKSIALLPNVLGKQFAVESRAQEVWFVDRDGFVTEGASTNAWIIGANDHIITRQRSPSILGGITRLAVIDLLRREALQLEERPFTVDEAKVATEAFYTSTSQFVVPVTRIDGTPVGNGKPGPRTLRLRELYLAHVEAAISA